MIKLNLNKKLQKKIIQNNAENIDLFFLFNKSNFFILIISKFFRNYFNFRNLQEVVKKTFSN